MRGLPRHHHARHAADESAPVTGRSPDPAHSAAAWPSCNTHWARPAHIGTSSGWETRCGTVGSSDTSSRRSREARCRFSQKISLLGDAGQLPTQVGQFLITWAAIAHKRLFRFLAQLPPPASQYIRVNPQFGGDLANAHTWGLQHRHRFALVLR